MQMLMVKCQCRLHLHTSVANATVRRCYYNAKKTTNKLQMRINTNQATT